MEICGRGCGVNGGITARAAASLFRGSLSYIYKALIRHRRTGEASASTRRGHQPCKLSPVQEAALAAWIDAHPDLTLGAGTFAQPDQTSQHRAAALPAWPHRYNWHRLNGSLDAKPPISRLRPSQDNLLRLHS